MRSVAILSLCLVSIAVAVDSSAQGWPWPWKTDTTTSVPVVPFTEFEHGVGEALGFGNIKLCAKDSNASIHDFWEAAQDYEKGGYVAKAKALTKFAEGMSKITVALAACADSMTEASKYKKLIGYLRDPRYYTWHNALTMALNIAEDRKQLTAFLQAWKAGNFKQAGFDLASTTLDVLERPGIPSSNGTAAVQLAYGFALGFAEVVNFKCFTDVEVEISALVGGVLDVMSVMKAVRGLESIFHGLEAIVPTYRQCMADKPKMMDLLHTLEDFHDAAGLAEKFGKHIEDNVVDLGLETASCVLDYKGAEWQRFGEDLGKIVNKIVIGSSTVMVV